MTQKVRNIDTERQVRIKTQKGSSELLQRKTVRNKTQRSRSEIRHRKAGQN